MYHTLTQLIAVNDFFDKHNKSVTASSATKAKQNNVKLCNFPQTEAEDEITNEIDYTRFRCWFKLINVSAQVLILGFKLMNLYKLDVKTLPTFSQAMKIVKNMWFKSMMKETKEMLKKTKLPGLMVFESDGITYVTTRSRQENWNPDKLVVLSPKHPLTKLILRSMHKVNHRGVAHTVELPDLESSTGFPKLASLSRPSRTIAFDVESKMLKQ
jgi:hypothetical protein